MKIFLSKSQFIKALQCHKALWLYKNKPDLRIPPDKFQQAVFDMGTDVGIYAQGLFPGGEEIKFEGSTFSEKIKQTQDHICMGKKTIYEATFQYDNVMVMVDILHKGEHGWEMYEVKASTGVKEVYLNDVSIQYYVVTGSGVPLSKTSVVCLNNKYVKNGDINIHELFAIHDLTEQVEEKQPFIKKNLEDIRTMLQGGCPDINIGPYCTSPYNCDFMEHCWQHIPANTVFDLRERGIDKFEYYNNGIINLSDLNTDDLNVKQKMQVEAVVNGQETIKKEEISKFLDTLYYPYYFLDFETFMPPVPLFDGTRPYQAIPFQYSLHVLEKENAELEHYEFLAEAGTDPREDLIKELIKSIPDNACVISYNSSYEQMILRQLSKQFPQYEKDLMKIHENMFDLMVPFKRRYYYTKEMKGSYSIKSVLPALVPDLSYKGMAVSGGGEAMYVYSGLHLIKDLEQVKQIRKDLLEYCKLDTLGMVKVLEKIKQL